MKKLLLLTLCALPLSAMQDPLKDHFKREAGKTMLFGGAILTNAGLTAAITGGGCTLFPPAALLLGGAYAAKKGYDWYYKQDVLNKSKGI